MAWAAANGIVNGIGEGKFDPLGKITREQLATILCRYTENRGIVFRSLPKILWEMHGAPFFIVYEQTLSGGDMP